MKRFIGVMKRRRVPLVIVVVLAAGGAFWFFFWGRQAAASDYITGRIERSNIEVTVSATGTVQAVTTVQVGSQVSGTVAWLGADFNSQVKKAQVIARLDPALFQTQVENARANVLNAEAAVQAAETDIINQKANLVAAKANLEVTRVQREDALALVKRHQELKSVISGRDVEASQALANVAVARYEQAAAQVGQSQAANESVKAKLAQAKASLAQAKAQLAQSSVNLEHATISSPIDGVVVSRNVDVGQTVAASLQAPTLFTIANDLTKMQVLASIDEADVGQIKQGIKANFTVDAYSGEMFSGEITQLRLNAQTLQNVVTYSAVIEVANPDMKLRPGMTANITIPVARRDNVLTVPNAALRFKPTLSEKEQQALKEKMEARLQQREGDRQGQGQSGQQQGDQGEQGSGGYREMRGQGDPATGQQRRPDQQGQRGDGRAQGAESRSQAGGQGRPQQPGGGDRPQQGSGGRPQAGGEGGSRRQGQMIWILADGKTLEQRWVRTGLTNGRVTEILAGDLHEGDTVVIGQNETNGNRAPQQPGSPFGQRPPMGPPRGR